VSVRVKVCGITRREDALLAAELGASCIGLIFWRHSPRFVTPDAARAIVEALPAGVAAVGVFVNAPPADVRRVVRATGLTGAQLHGEEAVEDFAGIGAALIKAVPVGPGFDADAVASIPQTVTVLLDAHDPARRGGTGRTIDWAAAAEVARRRPAILSGGLNAGNVADAVARVRPHMVDVSSGVESAPGVKDPEKLRAFFACLT
jgi:phosphoribosylanthranilate isomerase